MLFDSCPNLLSSPQIDPFSRFRKKAKACRDLTTHLSHNPKNAFNNGKHLYRPNNPNSTMVYSMRSSLATALLLAPLVQGQVIPEECNDNPQLAGGDYYCSVCPPGFYASSTTTQASAFGRSLDCFTWSVAGLCGVLPGGELGCDMINMQIQESCAPSCTSLSEFSIPTNMPTSAPTAAPTPFTLDVCVADENAEICGDEKILVCIEKKGDVKDKCIDIDKTLKGDEILLSCGGCPVVETTTEEPPVVETTTEEPPVIETTTEEPPVVETTTEEPIIVEATTVEPPIDDTPSISSCYDNGDTCGDDEAQVCVGKEPKRGRLLKKPKTKCIEVGKNLKKDEVVLSCGECP